MPLGGLWPNGTISTRNTVSSCSRYPLVRIGIGLGRAPGLQALFRELAFLGCSAQVADDSRAISYPILTPDFHLKTASSAAPFRCFFLGGQ